MLLELTAVFSLPHSLLHPAFTSTCSHHITVVIYCCAVLLHLAESELVMCSSFHVLACSFEYWEIWKRRQSPENRRWKFTLINIYLQARLKQKATNPAHWVSEHGSFEHPPVGVLISRCTLSSNFLDFDFSSHTVDIESWTHRGM